MIEPKPTKQRFQIYKSPCFYVVLGMLLLGMLMLVKRFMPTLFMYTGPGIQGAGAPAIEATTPVFVIIALSVLGVSFIPIAVGLIFCVAKHSRT